MLRDRPFITPCSADPADIATDGIVEMLRLGGVEMFSMSSFARWAGRTRSSVHQRYGGSAAFIDTVVGRFCRRWVDWATNTGPDVVCPVRLPCDPHEADGVRAWQAVRFVAHSERRAGRQGPSHRVEDALAAERRHVADHLGRRLGRPAAAREVEHVLALGEGLRARIVAYDGALSAGEAQMILRRHLVDTLELRLGFGDLDHDEAEVVDRYWRDRPAV